MKVILREMVDVEYQVFSEHCIRGYAKVCAAREGISDVDAIAHAKWEFKQTLPRGLNTRNHAVMIMEDSETGRKVGAVWYRFAKTGEEVQALLCELIVKKEERRKGYATAALACVEDDALNHGCKEIEAFVLKQNTLGIQLYSGCGYVVNRTEESGLYMRKILKSD